MAERVRWPGEEDIDPASQTDQVERTTPLLNTFSISFIVQVTAAADTHPVGRTAVVAPGSRGRTTLLLIRLCCFTVARFPRRETW